MRRFDFELGFVDYTALLLLVVLVAVGWVAWYSIKTHNEVDKAISQASAIVVNKDPYFAWKTFISKIDGFTFRYPGNWTSSIVYSSTAMPNVFNSENGYLTSPAGFKLSYSNPADGLGGACLNANGVCTDTTQTLSSTLVPSLSFETVYLVKQHIYFPDAPAANGEKPIDQIGLVSPSDYYSAKVGSVVGFPPYDLFKGKGQLSPTLSTPNTVWMYGSKTSSVNGPTTLASDKFFASPDTLTAEKILESAHY